MEYTTLGSTGLEVSRICLGCMSYGEPSRGNQPWSIGSDEARPFFRQALDLGINFFDTANVYSAGSSEEITGKNLWSMVKREDVVLATKVHGRMRPGPNGAGLSRVAIMHEVEESLRRLGTDYIDLYQIHRFDYATPIEETLEALNDLVRMGKVRYLGASSMHAWQFAKALFTSERHGWSKFISMQNHYNLLYREEEREMMGLCEDQGVGVIPWSPLARGRLARPWGELTHRSERDEFGAALYGESDRAVVDEVVRVAQDHGVSPASVSLAWLLAQSGVTSPIVGATKAHHLDEACAALDVRLAPDEILALESNYQPHAIAGFR